jgi:hypothetical protein
VALGYFSPKISSHQDGSWGRAASEITQEDHLRLENKLRKLTSLVDSAFSQQKLALKAEPNGGRQFERSNN